MIEWLVKFLGGYSKSSYDLLQVQVEAWRARAIAAETTVELFKEIMTRERERTTKLEDRLFPENKKQEPIVPPNLNPVGHSVSSWPRIKRELERLEQVKDAKVSREKIESEIRSEI